MASQDEFGAISPYDLFTDLVPFDWKSNPDDIRGCVVFEELETGEFWFPQIQRVAGFATTITAAAVIIGTTREVADEIKKQLSCSQLVPIVFCTDEALIHQLCGGLGQKPVLLTPLKPGHHIRRKLEGTFSSLGYHHGIYVGGGQVVHFTNETSGMVSGGQQAKILIETIEKFRMEKFPIEVVGGCYDRKEAVVRALQALYPGIYSTTYHLLKNNCEHFTQWCCTARASSPQAATVSEAIRTGMDLTKALTAVGLVLGAPTVSGIGAVGMVLGCIVKAVVGSSSLSN